MRLGFRAAVMAVALAAGACHRSEEAAGGPGGAGGAEADAGRLCAAPATRAALQAALLPPEGGRRYLARLDTASLHLSLSPAGEDGACTAAATFSSPLLADRGPQTMALSYRVEPQGEGGVRLDALQAADGGDVGRFAALLRHPAPPSADGAPAPGPAAMASATPAAPAPLPAWARPDADTDLAPRAPGPSLSADTQSLVDQAGDTRSAARPPADQPAAADPAQNSIAGTY